MLGLYLYTFRIGHKSGNMLGILNKLKLQKELQSSVTNNVLNTNTNTIKQKFKHKNPCGSRELNQEPIAPKADALPLHHRVNWEYRL